MRVGATHASPLPLKDRADGPLAESAFYLRFQRLLTDRRRALRTYRHEADAWRLFRRQCRFYGVR